MFSGASNSRSLQAIYLKFAEYVDILVQIIYAKFKNDRTKNSGDTGCMKMEKNFLVLGICFNVLFYFRAPLSCHSSILERKSAPICLPIQQISDM